MTAIILVRSSLYLGGVERQLLDHARRLQARSWQPHLICFYRRSGEHPLAEAARAAHLPATTIPDPHSAALAPLLRLRRLFDEIHPAIVHTCDYRSDILVWTARPGVPQVAESHGYTAENRRLALWNRLDSFVLRRLVAVAAVSSSWQTQLRAYGVSAAYVIGNSRAILPASPWPPPAELPGPGPHLLFAGRISPEKGLHRLLAAWPRLRQHYSQAQLWVLGDTAPANAYRQHLFSQLRQPGIHILNRQPDIRPWLQAVDAVVVPSQTEAWGMTVFEALCRGVPVVANKVGALPHLCDAAPHAHLIPNDDPPTLAAGIQHVLTPDFPRGFDLGRQYCHQSRFDPAQRFRQWLALYARVPL